MRNQWLKLNFWVYLKKTSLIKYFKSEMLLEFPRGYCLIFDIYDAQVGFGSKFQSLMTLLNGLKGVYRQRWRKLRIKRESFFDGKLVFSWEHQLTNLNLLWLSVNSDKELNISIKAVKLIQKSLFQVKINGKILDK